MSTSLEIALALLDRAAARLCDDRAPDTTWWRELFVLTRQHMILTDEGWEPGENRWTYLEEWEQHPNWANPILDEVNGPEPNATERHVIGASGQHLKQPAVDPDA